MNRTWTPTEVTRFFVLLFLALTFVSTSIALTRYVITMNENQILYLFSTSAQVIAAIYGLTLTGFIFFRNELSREESEDETLSDAVEILKVRYFILLVFITVLVTTALLLANLAISYEGSGNSRLSALIINAGQAAFLTSLFAISYFIFDVISPKRIELASKTLQSKVDPTLAELTRGSLEDFLRNYNQIEVLLESFGQVYEESAPSTYSQRSQRRMSNSRLAEILFRNESIDKSLFHRLRELITLRNSIIHGADPVVSQEMVKVSADVLEKLRDALDGDHIFDGL